MPKVGQSGNPYAEPPLLQRPVRFADAKAFIEAEGGLLVPDTPACELGGVRLGVNLMDLTDEYRLLPYTRQMLFWRNGVCLVDLKADPIWVDKDLVDETCVPFVCDLLTAACVLDTLRGKDRRAKDYPTRAYIFRKAWTKLAGSDVLTLVRGTEVLLNPAVFPPSVRQAEQSLRLPQRMI